MPVFFQRPENALKRANEYIEVGKSQRALEVLYDVIKSKKHRQWSKTHEEIMDKYLQLCVELRKSHIAKEGLYQYKNISQQVSIKSLEDVVRKYLKLAEDKTEAARKTSHQTVVDVDDLDVLETPENLLLSAVSGEDTQDRTDRAILTPWVKFLWESYRQCLDLLRNDSSVEKLYQDIAQQAFKFCLNYIRKTEFRKLCENLRTHLGHIHKHQHKTRAINLNNPESQAMHLETRMVQLDSAIQMELWQEAFKAVEDIHGLIALSKKPPKPAVLASYYQKVGLVFWKSGNQMFHACAFHRLFHLYRDQKKNVTEIELQKYASRVICATLAIPILPSRNQIDALLEQDETSLERQRRLASLLNLNYPPTRASLVKDLVKYNVIGYVKDTKLHDLYRWLEIEFHPLKLSGRVVEALNFIAADKNLKQYVTALQDIAITRLIKQVSQMYQTIEMRRLVDLIPFTDPNHLENVIVNCAKTLELQVRIDHKTKSLSFGTDLGVAQKEDVPEGPYLQNMPSEQIRNQLTQMARAMEKAHKIIQPVDMKRQELRAHIVQTYRQVARKEHMRILQRRQIIEERKEELENLTVKREMEEQAKLEEERKRQYDAEMARLEKEAEEREKKKKQQEHEDIQKKVARERLEQLKSTQLGQKAFEDYTEEDIAKMDMDDILAKQVEQIEKQKRELQEKLKAQEKKVDYFERAKRLEEIPLLEQEYNEWKEKDYELWQELEKERIKEEELKRQIAVENHNRLIHMEADKEIFITKLKEKRSSVLDQKLAEFDKMLAAERKKRLVERKEKRKRERREQLIKQMEEEKQRQIDEDLKRKREEEERAAQEKKEKEEAEYRERLRKLEEIEAKKRQREAEIEERARKDREQIKQKPESSVTPDQPGSAGWRDRIKDKEDSWQKDRRPEPEKEEPSWRRTNRDERKIERDVRKDEEQEDKKPDRDDRKFEKDERRDDRKDDKRFDRDERGRFDRDDKREDKGRFEREDRGRFDREDRGRFEREDRGRFEREDRGRFDDRRDERKDERRFIGRDDKRDDRRFVGSDDRRDDRRDGGPYRRPDQQETEDWRRADSRPDDRGKRSLDWRRTDARTDGRTEDKRDWRKPEKEPQQDWRRGAAKEEGGDWRKGPSKEPDRPLEDDGWTTVRR